MGDRRISFIISALLCAFLFIAEIAKADESANWGILQVAIKLEGKQLDRNLGIIKYDFYYPGNTDGFGGNDIEGVLFQSDMSGGFVDIEGHKVTTEYSANASRTLKHIKGYFVGTITPGSEPNITAELTWLFAEPTEGRF